MHAIYSDYFKGAGILSGGPYFCNEGIWNVKCTVNPELIDVDKLTMDAELIYNEEKSIANPANLKDAPVFLYSAMFDTIVVAGV
jgi:hypothetical protein